MNISEKEFVLVCGFGEDDYIFFKNMFNKDKIKSSLRERYESILFKLTSTRADLFKIDTICREVEDYFFPERFKADYDINDKKGRGFFDGTVNITTQIKKSSDNN